MRRRFHKWVSCPSPFVHFITVDWSQSRRSFVVVSRYGVGLSWVGLDWNTEVWLMILVDPVLPLPGWVM